MQKYEANVNNSNCNSNNNDDDNNDNNNNYNSSSNNNSLYSYDEGGCQLMRSCVTQHCYNII